MRIGGLASGFDTEQMVEQLMQVQRLPLDRIYQQKIRTEWQRDQYRNLMTKISSFRDLVFDMQLQSTYLARLVASSDETMVKAQVVGQAQYGTYDLKVKQLAAAATKVSAGGVNTRFEEFVSKIDPSEPITIGLRADKNAAEFTAITIEHGETITSFVKKINDNKELGITAFYDDATGSLVFRSNATGANAVVEFDDAVVADGAGGTLSFVNDVLLDQGDWVRNEEGRNAEFEINGLATYRESNTFTFGGLSITLRAADENKVVTLEVTQDTDRIVGAIKNLVDKYNELIAEINGKLTEPIYRDYPPLTEAQKKEMDEKDIELWEEKAKSGLLRSDRILTDLVADMRKALSSVVDGVGLNTLSKIGITTGSWYEHGKLHINETQLRNAVQNNPDDVIALFTKNGETQQNQGIARRLNSVLTEGMDRLAKTAGKASSIFDQSTLSEKIRSYEKQIAVMEDRMIELENRYWLQFVAMERALQQLYAQSDWLYQQLSVMNR